MAHSIRHVTGRYFAGAFLALGSLTLPACGGVVHDNSDGNADVGSCSYDGKTYANGASFPSSDGCNTCNCDSGTVGCTLVDCVGGCFLDGTFYEANTPVPSKDCNSCYCDESGQVSCTEKDCGSCEDVASTYQTALGDAKKCDPSQPNQCTQLTSYGLACSCETFANPENVDALKRAETASGEYWAMSCGNDYVCGACLAPTSGYCSAEGRCEDNQNTGSGAACKVDGVIYESGTSGIKDPQSCNSCVCQDGQLACDDAFCPEGECPPNAVFGTQCAQCGPTDGCEVVEHTCLPLCAEGCVSGACVSGVCMNVCG